MCVQLHTQASGASACSTAGRLVVSPADLRDIFIAATAELPGLLLAAVVMDVLGRKWCVLPPFMGVMESPIDNRAQPGLPAGCRCHGGRSAASRALVSSLLLT